MVRLAPPTRDDLSNLDGFRVEHDDHASRVDIVLDRPAFNAISMLQREQLSRVFDALDHDPAVRVVVLRAEGEHFCNGDETGAPEVSAQQAARLAWHLNAPSRCSKLVIAASRGYCFGAGFELSLACDFRIATETTLYALPAQKLGQGNGAARLLRTVGIGRAKDIVMRSRYIRGAQAYEWGLATEFVVDSDLESATDALVQELLGFSALTQRTAKKLLNDMDGAPSSFGMGFEGHSHGHAWCASGARNDAACTGK